MEAVPNYTDRQAKMSCWNNTHCPNTCIVRLEKTETSQITADHSNHMDEASDDDFNTDYYGHKVTDFRHAVLSQDPLKLFSPLQ
jgi:hypothetical protein